MTPLHSPTWLLLAVAVPIVTACATGDNALHPFRDGWREVRVEQIASGLDIHHAAVRDCREGLSPAQLASMRFAVLSYAHLRSRHTVILPLADGASPQAGDVFSARTSSCAPLQTPTATP